MSWSYCNEHIDKTYQEIYMYSEMSMADLATSNPNIQREQTNDKEEYRNPFSEIITLFWATSYLCKTFLLP